MLRATLPRSMLRATRPSSIATREPRGRKPLRRQPADLAVEASKQKGIEGGRVRPTALARPFAAFDSFLLARLYGHVGRLSWSSGAALRVPVQRLRQRLGHRTFLISVRIGHTNRSLVKHPYIFRVKRPVRRARQRPFERESGFRLGPEVEQDRTKCVSPINSTRGRAQNVVLLSRRCRRGGGHARHSGTDRGKGGPR
jgi:hypothetical protein